MKKKEIQLEEIKLVGIKVRTNNQDELNPSSSKIARCVQRYFKQQLSGKISNRKNPGTTFCAYTEYESDHSGDYSFFIGEAVTAIDQIPEGLETLSIPKQSYAKFTTEPGRMPMVVIDAWQKIWQMSSQDLGGARRYHTDFEIYDKRALDSNNSVVDIYIGIVNSP